MSVRFVPVQWNRNKWVYDGLLLAAVMAYLTLFLGYGAGAADATRPVDGAILRMRAFGSCAFFLLTLILCIGPLARLDRRFLPLLYNRRHFGVLTAAVALTHAVYVVNWYFAFAPTPQIEALLASNTSYGQLLGFPIEALGIFALLCLLVLAASSHDFWLSFLGAPVWKRLHLLIYPAYLAVVAHVALGALQDAKNPGFAIFFGAGAMAVSVLHLAAWWRTPSRRRAKGDWVAVCSPGDIADQRARIIRLPSGDRAAVFRDGAAYSALSNACAHQGGPLGEGRIIDGCVTCPWHGFQYRMRDGCSPAPFSEKVPTYNLRLRDGVIEIAASANPPGTAVDPLTVGDPA
ncbi:Rieske 2Fe-2S domain-containing protein [Meridianimarinicoccus sp. MJW13]|uniref:Rieske 2Fe-2S domain-containing protein n=1 Tax=Meridianimarinicoccus sp. MJW13 TaxID=2720031 RepID=UPI0018664D12|nr:Rieske 2Fe-2S domain-containing protein [Fluviibacterium sp. MJW13]